jgi:hypothetical protein
MPAASSSSLKHRVAQLEREVATLKGHLQPGPTKANPWIDELFGVFQNDPTFKEAMRLGREYSKSLDGKSKKRKTGRNGHSRH